MRRRTAAGRRSPPRASARAPVGATPDRLDRALRLGLFGAIGLVLLTPFVVTAGTVFPYVVGKALWSRAAIEVAFALWAGLALRRREYRPPRSWLLVLLAAGYAVALLAAAFGVSPHNSLWSDYERMQGLLDRAHWVALAFVLVSVLRTVRAWRALLGANVAAGAAVACIVIARALDIELPYFGKMPELVEWRSAGPLGNPAFLSVYMLVNGVLAAAFAARAWAAGRPPLGWLLAVALHLYALLLAGSVGGFAGLAAATGFAALGFAWLSPGRGRVVAVAVLALLGVAGVGLGARFLGPEPAAPVALDGPAVEWPGAAALGYVGSTHLQRPSVQSRLAAWEAGIDGFAERPLLGVGPGNFTTVFGLYGSGYAATAEPHDQAHGKLVEVAATTGAAGLVAWLALWGGALAVLLSAARGRAPPARAFIVFAAAALGAYLVQVQFLFDTAVGTLLATLLLAFAAGQEERVVPERLRPRLPGRLAAPAAASLRSLHRPRVTRAALGAAALAVALGGLALNRTILLAADNRHVVGEAVVSGATAEGIDAFPPLAGFYRKFMFAGLARNWAALRAEDPARAAALLERAGREAAEARRSEPLNWRFEHLLAQLYTVAAASDRVHETAAQQHLARARELAPARDPLPRALQPPGALAAVPMGDGVELRWNPSRGAGYHQIARSTAGGPWRAVLYAYEPGRSAFRAPAGDHRYRIKACRYARVCSAWVEWP